MGTFKLEPISTKLTNLIFQAACKVEDIDAKFGYSLSNEENNVRRYILTQSPILGRIPSIDEIQKKFTKISEEKLKLILGRLDKLDVIHLNESNTNIDAAYPFSRLKTPQVIKFKKKSYKDIYAMCAVDALGVGFMLKSDFSIISKCFHCDEEIQIEIEDNKIIQINPESTMVWFHSEYSCCAATSLCNKINFFASKNHNDEWKKTQNSGKGYLLNIQEAFSLGKKFFQKRL